jgi:5-methylcytosine-specific restriction endonuclease McrA
MSRSPRPGASRPALNKSCWQKLRAQAKARDGHACRMCGGGMRLQVHHIVRPQDGGSDALENLVTLCSPCHRLLHQQQGAGVSK